MTFDRDRYESAVAELRFEEAARLLEESDEAGSLWEELQARREQAGERAQDLYQRITRLGADERYADILAIRREPGTEQLLALLPASSRRHAEAFLGTAVRWAGSMRRTNERRLTEANKALAALDFALARGLANRIDREFLDDEEALDRLLLDIEARAMELAPLREAAREADRKDRSDGNRWWRRRRN